MESVTLGILLQGEQMLLGEKKRGEIGTGKLSGPGGHLEIEDKTLEECLIRETREELALKLDPSSIELVACLTTYTGSKPDLKVFVYRACILSGQTIVETADMIPRWYPLNNLPYEQMYDADRYWILKAARGEKFCAKVYYRERAKGFLKIKFFPFSN